MSGVGRAICPSGRLRGMSSRLSQDLHAGGPGLQVERRDDGLLNAFGTFQSRCRQLAVSMLCGRRRSGGYRA
jgi:hypothetical protein